MTINDNDNYQKKTDNNIKKISINKINNTFRTKTTPIVNEIFVDPHPKDNKSDGSINNPFKTIDEAMNSTQNNTNNMIHLSTENHLLSETVVIKNITFMGSGRDDTNITCNYNQGFKLKHTTA